MLKMKIKIAAMLAVMISAHLHALAEEPKDKAAARAAMWQAAVKADVPPPPAMKQASKPAAAEPAAKPVSLPLYYSAQRNVPPLPFNPYPKFGLFDLGDNKFAYDDREVDFSARVALASQAGGAMMAMEAEEGGAGPAAMMFSASDLWVQITKSNSSNGLRLDVNNTVSGTYYGVGEKSSIDTDPFNTWTLTSVFQATSTNRQLARTATAATRFYKAVNLDAYVGPSVSIVSPAAGATVSNDMPLQVRVTDILPLTAINIYVDGVQVGAVISNQNGTITVPTSWFPNGQHQIWVSAVNEGVPVDTDGDAIADDIVPFQTWANVTVNFTNEVRMQNYSPLYTKAGSITLQYSVTGTQNYTFEVFKTNGTLLHTTNGQAANGTLSRQWNYTDLSGNPVTEGAYAFSLTHSNAGAAAAVAKKIITTNSVDNGVSVGKYVISYGEWADSTINTGLANLSRSLSIRMNEAAYYFEEIIGTGREAYGTIYSGFHSDPFPIRGATQTNDVLALTNALKDTITGSWFFDGHGTLIAGPGSNAFLTVRLTAKQIAGVLDTTYSYSSSGLSVDYGRRLFSTMLTACGSATGDFSTATGTPAGVDQDGNSQIKKSAFLGFSGTAYTGSTQNGWTYRIHYEWLDEEGYDTEISTAVWRANLAYPTVQGWGPTLYGFSFLGYNADESR